MTFLVPLAFALLALIPPIIALYLLKLRRQDHVVSSTYLWQRFVRDVEANAPWQKLRRNLLLFLQILLLLLLILALARPATQAEGVAGQTLILILDTSASMAATDGDTSGQTRLNAAQATARELATNLPDDARVTVLAAAGGQVETLISASQDRRQVLSALDSLQPTAQNSDLTPALTLAEALVARESRAEIILLSDGAVQLPAQLSAPVRFISLGRSAANQAISALSLTPATNGTSSLFVQVSNYHNEPAQRRLVIQVDETPFTAFDLDIPAGGHVEQIIESIPTNAQSVAASLSSSPTDFLPLDDQAQVVVRSGSPAQTTLVTNGNFFLQTALNLLNSGRTGTQVELTVISPEDWKVGSLANNPQPSNPPPLQPSNVSPLTIFDSYTPDTLPPGNLLFIAPPDSIPGLFDVLGQTINPVPQPAIEEHPLLKNLTLAETQILTTSVISAPSWSQIIISGQIQASNPSTSLRTGPSTLQPSPPLPSIPLLLAGEVEGRRVVILPFALQQSDLPLRPAFPIIMANFITYLAPGAASLLPVDVVPGQTLSLSLPAAVNQLRLVAPDGATATVAAEAGRVTLPPLIQPGLYHITFEPGDALPPATLAVNFFNPLESNIAPKPNLAVTGSATVSNNVTPLPPAYQEWWRPLAVGALILLVIEWLVYHRSTVWQYWAITQHRLHNHKDAKTLRG